MARPHAKSSPQASTVTAAPRERSLLFTATGRDAPRQVMAEQSRLEALYLRARKKKLPADILFHTSLPSGQWEHAAMGLMAAYTPEQEEDVIFLRQQAKCNPPAQAAGGSANNAPDILPARITR